MRVDKDTYAKSLNKKCIHRLLLRNEKVDFFVAQNLDKMSKRLNFVLYSMKINMEFWSKCFKR